MFNEYRVTKQKIRKLLVLFFDIKSIDIAHHLNVSKSVISRHMTGELELPEVDIYIIEKVFGLKIKEYKIV